MDRDIPKNTHNCKLTNYIGYWMYVGYSDFHHGHLFRQHQSYDYYKTIVISNRSFNEIVTYMKYTESKLWSILNE